MREEKAMDFLKIVLKLKKSSDKRLSILDTLPDICAPESTESELVLSLPSTFPLLIPQVINGDITYNISFYTNMFGVYISVKLTCIFNY